MKNRAAFILVKAFNTTLDALAVEGSLTKTQPDEIRTRLAQVITTETEGEFEIRQLFRDIVAQLSAASPETPVSNELPRTSEQYSAAEDENMKVQQMLQERMEAAAKETKERTENERRLQETRKANSRRAHSRRRALGRAG